MKSEGKEGEQNGLNGGLKKSGGGVGCRVGGKKKKIFHGAERLREGSVRVLIENQREKNNTEILEIRPHGKTEGGEVDADRKKNHRERNSREKKIKQGVRVFQKGFFCWFCIVWAEKKEGRRKKEKIQSQR